jgi:hypothetical protein
LRQIEEFRDLGIEGLKDKISKIPFYQSEIQIQQSAIGSSLLPCPPSLSLIPTSAFFPPSSLSPQTSALSPLFFPHPCLSPQTSSLSPDFSSAFRIPHSDFDIASLPPGLIVPSKLETRR